MKSIRQYQKEKAELRKEIEEINNLYRSSQAELFRAKSENSRLKEREDVLLFADFLLTKNVMSQCELEQKKYIEFVKQFISYKLRGEEQTGLSGSILFSTKVSG